MNFRAGSPVMDEIQEQLYLPELWTGLHPPAAFFKDASLDGAVASAKQLGVYFDRPRGCPGGYRLGVKDYDRLLPGLIRHFFQQCLLVLQDLCGLKQGLADGGVKVILQVRQEVKPHPVSEIGSFQI
jgi:hypothetical protein